MPNPSAPTIPSFFFNDTATTEISPLSLHDALPILTLRRRLQHERQCAGEDDRPGEGRGKGGRPVDPRPLEQRGQIGRATSELQSRPHLVCRLLLEKKKDT